MPTPITPELLKPYFSGTKKHKAYKDSVNLYTEMKIHLDGEYPAAVIDAARPNEPDYIKEYRKKIFAHITMPAGAKVLNSISKIRKSPDWGIKFNKKNFPASIAQGEDPDTYINYNFPFFGSLTSWAFSMFLKQYNMDSNGLIVMMPLEFEVPSNSYCRPFPFIFNSDRVIEYVQGDYAIVKSTDESTYMDGGVSVVNGAIYYVITTTFIQKWEQRQSETGYVMTSEYIHGFNKLPAWRMGGVGWKQLDNTFLWKPRLYPMVPFLNEAVREYSDLQAGVVQHLLLEKWEYEGEACTYCKGTGKVKEGEKNVKCPAGCKNGVAIRSPYETLTIKRQKMGEIPAPNPLAGFIPRDIEIIKVQDARIDKHIHKALAALNMEFLDAVPLVASGASKIADRDEANNFVHSEGEDIVANLDNICYFSGEYRYTLVVKDEEVRKSILPSIGVPEKFDLFNTQILVDEIAQVQGKVNASIKMALEAEYITKKFGYDQETKNSLLLSLELDPLPGYSSDEKASALMNGGITETDYIISCNITPFVKRALEEDKSFGDKKRKDQLAVLSVYAKEKGTENSAAEKLKADAAQRAIDNNPVA
jgi:hypothetical protein